MAPPVAPAADHPWRLSRPILAVFALGLALRLALVPFAGVYHPDELFQYLEQAHRLLFDRGVVPWEYRLGMRSWLLPLTLTGPMIAGEWLAPGTTLYLLLPRTAAALLSLTLIWSAWRIAARHSPQHALIAAIIAAVWPEFVYFAPHILSETASIALILPAAVLLTGRRTIAGLLSAGLLLGIATVLRLQHAPAIATLVVLTLWKDRAAWPPVIAGGCVALLASAAIDCVMGQAPFGWAIEYFRQNILHDRAASYGVSAYWAYAQGIGLSLGWWALPMLLLGAIGARREPVLFRVALVNLVVHMAIAHKEYRFVLLTTAILLILAAVGTGEIVALLQRRSPARRKWMPVFALSVWGLASILLAATERPARYGVLDARALALFGRLRSDPGLCGLATQSMHFSAGGGYAYLHRDVPIYAYAPAEAARLARETRAFNRLVAPAAIAPPPGFRMSSCRAGTTNYPAACIFARAGGCEELSSPAEINRQLVRTGQ